MNREGIPVDYFLASWEFLINTTGVDIFYAPYMATGVFGLDMGRPQIQEFVRDYYYLVQTGLGFLSEWPETNVLMALFSQPKNESIKIAPHRFVLAGPVSNESDEKVEEFRKQGFYFYIREHNLATSWIAK